MTEKSAAVHWEGQGKKGQGQISTETSALKAYPYGFGSRFEDDRSGTNPEELLGAAHAACFTMAFSFACDKAGFATKVLDTRAKVRLTPQGDGFVIDRIALELDAEIDGIDDARFQEIAEAAKKACPLSKALASVPEITLRATLGGAGAKAPAGDAAASPTQAPVAAPARAATAANGQKTNFSFEVQVLAQAGAASPARDALMQDLGPTLQSALAAADSAATVTVSDSHKGGNNKLVELTSTLQDEALAKILKTFADTHGVAVSALE